MGGGGSALWFDLGLAAWFRERIELGGPCFAFKFGREGLHLAFDATARLRILRFVENCVCKFLDESLELPGFDKADVLFAEALRVHAFEEPSARPPMLLSSAAYGSEGIEFGREDRVGKTFVEFFVAAELASDGARGAADVAGGTLDIAALGHQGAEFGLFDFIEGAGTTC